MSKEDKESPKERILRMLIRILRLFLKFFESRVLKAKEKRIARRMDRKK